MCLCKRASGRQCHIGRPRVAVTKADIGRQDIAEVKAFDVARFRVDPADTWLVENAALRDHAIGAYTPTPSKLAARIICWPANRNYSRDF